MWILVLEDKVYLLEFRGVRKRSFLDVQKILQRSRFCWKSMGGNFGFSRSSRNLSQWSCDTLETGSSYAFPSENKRLKIQSFFNVIESLGEVHEIPNSLVGILRGGTDIASEESLYCDFVQGSLSHSGYLHLPVRILLSHSKNRSLDIHCDTQ